MVGVVTAGELLCEAPQSGRDGLVGRGGGDFREVMALAAQGLSNDEIAEKLVVSTNTVRTHIQRAMMKLRARDGAQLVVIAYQTGLVRP